MSIKRIGAAMRIKSQRIKRTTESGDMSLISAHFKSETKRDDHEAEVFQNTSLDTSYCIVTLIQMKVFELKDLQESPRVSALVDSLQ